MQKSDLIDLFKGFYELRDFSNLFGILRHDFLLDSFNIEERFKFIYQTRHEMGDENAESDQQIHDEQIHTEMDFADYREYVRKHDKFCSINLI